MSNINEKVRKNIKYFRQKRYFTQEKLALVAGLHRSYIGQVERGEKNIGLSNLEKISKALNVDIKDFF